MSPAPDSLVTFRDAVAALPHDLTTPARLQNRLMRLVTEESERLASSSDGRAELEWACASDPNLWVRLSASVAVQAWNVPLARFALGAIVEASGGQGAGPMTITSALAVRDEPGRSAALCLMNLDSGRWVRPGPGVRTEAVSVPVPADELDAAIEVVGLTMNGGLDHAYEVAGHRIPAARRALAAVGESAAARVLADLLSVVGEDPSSATIDDRVRTLEGLGRADVDGVERLSEELIGMADVLNAIEAAPRA